MASSVSGQNEPNRALWLATRAGKMEPSCPLGTTRCIPQEKFHQKPYNKSFIDQVFSVKMAGYWPRSFFASLWTSTSSRSIYTQKKNLANIQPSWPHTWSITHTYWRLAHRHNYKKIAILLGIIEINIHYCFVLYARTRWLHWEINSRLITLIILYRLAPHKNIIKNLMLQLANRVVTFLKHVERPANRHHTFQSSSYKSPLLLQEQAVRNGI